MKNKETIENKKNDECEIVKEVLEIRHKISARFDHDVDRVVAYYQKLQEQMQESGKHRFAALSKKVQKISESTNTEASD